MVTIFSTDYMYSLSVTCRHLYSS